MKKNTLAWFVIAGAGIAFSGLGMAACSSSSATGNPSDDSSGGDGGGGDATNQTDGNNGGDSAVNTDSGSDSGTCGSTPTLHKDTDDAGREDIYCSPATGSASYCEIEAGTLNHCCIDTSGTGFPNGACTTGACPAGNLDIQCNDDSSCAAGLHCCGLGHPYVNATCGYAKIYGFTGTQCAASCPSLTTDDAGTFQACSETNTTCLTGTCTPAKEYIQLGVCK
jgi:hypothetical protein